MGNKIDSHKFSDREMIYDAVCSQKQMAAAYNNVTEDTSSPQLHDVWMTLLNEEHQICFDLCSEMSKRGWHFNHPADLQQLQQTRQRFQQPSTQ